MAALELYVAEAVEEKSEIAPDEIADLAARLAEAKNPIIVIDTSRAGAALARLAAMVAVIIQSEHEKTAPLLALRSAANSHGLTRLGINPLTLAECTGKTVLAIREDIVTHAQDLSENWQGTLIVMDCIHSESSATAEVVLPLPAPFEIYGTLFATGGLRQTLTAATPAGGEDAVRSLATLAEKAGAHLVEGKEIIPQLRTEMTADLSALPANEEVCTACPSADSFTRLVKSWADKLGLL